jgi:hypothetical protein
LQSLQGVEFNETKLYKYCISTICSEHESNKTGGVKLTTKAELQKRMEEQGWYEIEEHVIKQGFQRIKDLKFLQDIDALNWINEQKPGGMYSIIRVEITRTVLRTIRR